MSHLGGKADQSEKRQKKKVYWFCRCSCGNDTWVFMGDLTGGNTKSCGCLRREGGEGARNGRYSVRHGHAVRRGPDGRKLPRSGTYYSWQRLWQRVTNRKREGAHRYVKRGITADPRWRSFEAFLADMGERPPGKTLHRINNNCGYSAENCKWETPSEQVRNRCNTKLTFNAAVQIALRAFRGEHHQVIANDFAISTSMVSMIATGNRWRDAFLEARASHQGSRKGIRETLDTPIPGVYATEHQTWNSLGRKGK